MIAPLQPFPIKGAIWYQGESNNSRARQYRDLFPLLIADWRRAWGTFPFLFVQIAPYNGMSPEIREAQLLTLEKSPKTAMAVITDAGDATNIHPAHKQPVGARGGGGSRSPRGRWRTARRSNTRGRSSSRRRWKTAGQS
jgi:sialate O-acetylesterase